MACLNRKKLLKLGVVQPTRSKFNCPIFVVAKKNGGAPTCARLLGTQCPNTQGQIFNEGLVKLEDPTVPSFPPLILLLVTGKFSINQNLDKMAFTISGLGQFQ
jgi:hypothetical protein